MEESFASVTDSSAVKWWIPLFSSESEVQGGQHLSVKPISAASTNDSSYHHHLEMGLRPTAPCLWSSLARAPATHPSLGSEALGWVQGRGP